MLFCSSVEDLLNDEDDVEEEYNLDDDQEEKLLQDDSTCENEVSENELDESEDVLNLEAEEELEEDDGEGNEELICCMFTSYSLCWFIRKERNEK